MQLERDTIIQETKGKLVTDNRVCRMARSLAWDSRKVEADSLFIALPGAKVDGHDFLLQAAEQGAAGAITQRQPDADLCEQLSQLDTWLIVVDNCQRALENLASYWRGQLPGRVIALTGSSGKTTTKNLIRDCLSAHGNVTATLSNQNNELGVPATILAAQQTDDFVVVEMGMRGLEQISQLCSIARPDIALVTNVGSSHMELLGSQENIARAKSEIFAGLHDKGIALLNAHDPYCQRMHSFAQLDKRLTRCIYYNGSVDQESYVDNEPSIFVRDVSFDAQGHPSFTLCSTMTGSLETASCSLSLRGAHNVENAVATAAVGLSCGMQLGSIAQALQAAQPEQGRQDVIAAPNGLVVIDDSYNANPDSMRASLATFEKMAVPGRRIAVLGDMGELGSFSDEGHRVVGQLAGKAGLDTLVCVGERSRAMAQAAIEAGLPSDAVQCVEDAQEALEVLMALQPVVAADDYILVKASHAMGLEEVVKGLVS